MNDKLDENPEIMAGVAMSIAKERHALQRKAAEARGTASQSSTGSGLLTALVVVGVLIGTLAFMIYMGTGN